jgi:hypothetical protein
MSVCVCVCVSVYSHVCIHMFVCMGVSGGEQEGSNTITSINRIAYMLQGCHKNVTECYRGVIGVQHGHVC